ncbi:MAG: hypothetical protein NVSMB16_05490 [Acidimicrobiales bacterium]
MASISELQEASMGLTDKAIGLFREAIGTVIGNDGLSEAGKAQQEKGTDRLEAIKHEAKADAYLAQAKVERILAELGLDGPGIAEATRVASARGRAPDPATL